MMSGMLCLTSFLVLHSMCYLPCGYVCIHVATSACRICNTEAKIKKNKKIHQHVGQSNTIDEDTQSLISAILYEIFTILRANQ